MPSIPLFCHYNMYSFPRSLIPTVSCLIFIPFFFLPFLPLLCLSILPPSTSITEPSMYIFLEKDRHVPHANHGDSHVLLNVF